MNARWSVSSFIWARPTLASAGVTITLVLFLLLAHQVHAGETIQFDVAVHRFFQSRQSPLIHALMMGVSLFASGWAISIISMVCLFALWFRPAFRGRAVSLLLAGAGGQGIVYLLKALFHRARPEANFASLGYSFPSGHAFAAVTIYGMLACWLIQGERPHRRSGIGLAAAVLILLIGFSRVYLGVHYASDVAAGYAAGVPWLWGCLALNSRGKAKETI